MANTTYEEAIRSLELARRLSLGADYTSVEEKKINPNDGLIIKALKEKYQDVKDPGEWSKFGAKLIVVAQKELKLVNDKLAGTVPTTALETTPLLQAWKTDLEGILSPGSQDAFRKLTNLAISGGREITEIPPAVLKETERAELIRLRTENYQLMKMITELPSKRTPSKNTSTSSTSTPEPTPRIFVPPTPEITIDKETFLEWVEQNRPEFYEVLNRDDTIKKWRNDKTITMDNLRDFDWLISDKSWLAPVLEIDSDKVKELTRQARKNMAQSVILLMKQANKAFQERERERARSGKEEVKPRDTLGGLGDQGGIGELDPPVRGEDGELRDWLGNIIEDPEPPKPKSKKELRKEKKKTV